MATVETTMNTPAPAPATTEKLKRVQKPDHDKFRKEINAVKEKIDKLIEKRNALNQKFSRNTNEAQNAKRNELRSTLEKIRIEQAKIKKSRVESIDKIKELQSLRRKKNDELRNTRQKLQIQNPSSIDTQISNLEKRIESGVNVNEEKRYLQEISKLKQAKNQLAKAEKSVTDLNVDEKIKELEDEIKKLNEKRVPLEKQYTEVKAELDALEEKRRAESANFKELRDERNKLKEEIETSIEKRRELSAAFKTQKDEYAKFVAQDRARRQEEYQKRKQAERDELLARKFQAELELAEIPAFTEEVNTCNTLITLLKAQLNEGKGSVAPAAEKAAVDYQNSIPEGAIMLNSKSDRDDEVFFVGKKKNNKRNHKNNNAKESKNAPVKYDLGVMESFWSIKVDVPTSMEEIATTIKTLEEKKEYYLANREEQTRKNKENAERKIAEHRKKIEAGEENIEDDVADEE